jgi:hypothetical protein
MKYTNSGYMTNLHGLTIKLANLRQDAECERQRILHEQNTRIP